MRIQAVNFNLKNSPGRMKSLKGFASVTLVVEEKELVLNDFRVYDNGEGRAWVVLPELEWMMNNEVHRKFLLRLPYSWEEPIKTRILDEYRSLMGVKVNGK